MRPCLKQNKIKIDRKTTNQPKNSLPPPLPLKEKKDGRKEKKEEWRKKEDWGGKRDRFR